MSNWFDDRARSAAQRDAEVSAAPKVGISRRRMLQRTAVVGGAAWVAPTLISAAPAWAASCGTGQFSCATGSTSTCCTTGTQYCSTTANPLFGVVVGCNALPATNGAVCAVNTGCATGFTCTGNFLGFGLCATAQARAGISQSDVEAKVKASGAVGASGGSLATPTQAPSAAPKSSGPVSTTTAPTTTAPTSTSSAPTTTTTTSAPPTTTAK